MLKLTNQQRHGDSVWRVRLQGQGEAWPYLLVMLEFQSTTDRFMAVRILVYTGLLYQDLIRRGALDEAGRLPPVLPVVLYNGPERWTAPVEVGGTSSRRPGRRWRPSSPRSGISCLTRGDGGRTSCGVRSRSGFGACRFFFCRIEVIETLLRLAEAPAAETTGDFGEARRGAGWVPASAEPAPAKAGE